LRRDVDVDVVVDRADDHVGDCVNVVGSAT
jgi:murein tripeptide amidase MpaA